MESSAEVMETVVKAEDSFVSTGGSKSSLFIRNTGPGLTALKQHMHCCYTRQWKQLKCTNQNTAETKGINDNENSWSMHQSQ